MGRIRYSCILACMVLVAPIATAANIPQYDYLFARASTCGNTADTQCPGAPSNFCCPSNTKCLVLASNTTVLCCPTGSDCSLIQPIVCDVSQQNATAFPDATIKTSNLSGTLQTCGAKCCPFGFSCNSNNVCALNPNQGTSPSQTTLPATASSTPTISAGSSSISSTSTSESTSPATSTSSSNHTPIPLTGGNNTASASCTSFPARAIIAGFFPGVALGALLAILSICLLGRRRNKRASSSYTRRPNSNGSSTFGKVAASISDPIYHDTGAMRTDFIRKAPATPPARQPTIQRVRSLFRKSAATTSSSNDGDANVNRYFQTQTSPTPPVPMVPRPPMPVTPRTPKLQREPSGESINIFTDPRTARSMDHDRDRAGVRASGQTTFTDMMERADLGGVRRGEAFVETPTPGPGRGADRWR